MNNTIIVAVLSLVGTLIGSMAGILTANKLVNYRIEQLEKKVDKHNQVIERVYKLEQAEAVDNDKCVEFFNKLANINDFTNKEDYIITLSANTYGLCEDSTLAIATSKGWAVTSG